MDLKIQKVSIQNKTEENIISAYLIGSLNIEDPLWLDVDDPRFGIIAQVGRIARVY